jgi:putative (di)nucleoside polyphosphate hydrolase
MRQRNADITEYRPCVGIMVLNNAGQVWIGRRTGSKNTDPNGTGLWWQMPQGGIDPGEAPADAAFRELHEETGIRPDSVVIIGETRGWHRYDLPEKLMGRKWGGRFRGQEQKWFAMRFSGRDEDVNIDAPPPHEVEFDAWRWAATDELLDIIVPFKRQVYEAVLNEFAELLRL